LKLAGLLGRDGDGHEAAEAGVDAVRVLATAMRRVFDKVTGGPHPLPRLVGEFRGGALDGNRPDVVHGQVVAREADRRPLRHDASLGRSSLRTLPYVPPGGVATPCKDRIAPGVTPLSRLCRGSPSAPVSLLLVCQEPQLEHVRRVEAGHAEEGTR